MFNQSCPLFRCVTIATILTFLPTSVSAWNFLDPYYAATTPPQEFEPWAELPSATTDSAGGTHSTTHPNDEPRLSGAN